MMRKFVSFALCGVLIAAFIFFTHAQMSDKAQLGRELFHDPTLKGRSNPVEQKGSRLGYSCANCHADFDDTANPDGVIRAGHSVIGVPHRGRSKRRDD